MRWLPLFLSIILALTLSSTSMARVYKCKDSEGNISYSQTTCAVSTEQKTLHSSSGAPSVSAEVCQFASEYAGEVFSKIRRGRSVIDIINNNGGVNSIKPRLLGLINYVSGFQAYNKISASRVSQLTFTKCQNNGFGQMTLDDIPIHDPLIAQRREILRTQQEADKAYKQAAVASSSTVSIDFRSAPVRQVLQNIATQAGVPLIIDSSVSGSITIKMDNVPWQQALAMVVQQKQLQFGPTSGGLLISAP